MFALSCEVYTEVKIEFVALSVAPCSVVAGCHRFGGPFCIYLQGWYQTTTKRDNP
jgi:predicted hydrocarbon binding protein